MTAFWSNPDKSPGMDVKRFHIRDDLEVHLVRLLNERRQFALAYDGNSAIVTAPRLQPALGEQPAPAA